MCVYVGTGACTWVCLTKVGVGAGRSPTERVIKVHRKSRPKGPVKYAQTEPKTTTKSTPDGVQDVRQEVGHGRVRLRAADGVRLVHVPDTGLQVVMEEGVVRGREDAPVLGNVRPAVETGPGRELGVGVLPVPFWEGVGVSAVGPEVAHEREVRRGPLGREEVPRRVQGA